MTNTYRTAKELFGKTLDFDDEVVFSYEGKNYVYHVRTDFLSAPDADNDKIFRALSIPDKYRFATKHYGYISDSGQWPVFEEEDYEAATKLVLAIYDKCGDYCVVGDWKSHINNKVKQ